MITILKFIRHQPLTILILALPLAILSNAGQWGEVWVFSFATLAVIPMAQFIGEGTEALAEYTGPRLGGLLNATLGNAAELIITIIAIRAGLLELVKASITGSILGNLLFVLGLSMALGGIRHGIQNFNRQHATRNAVLLILTVLILSIPSLLSHSIGENTDPRVETLSLGVAGVMIVLYGLALLYSLKASGAPMAPVPQKQLENAKWPLRKALIILALATFGVVIASELLVGAVEPVVQRLGISEFFLGIILIPIVGNVAEHLVAVKFALHNEMELSVEIAIASSLQVALFVAPVLVFVSLLFGHPLQLIFNKIEILALGAGVLITALVSADGESNWLEGVELMAVYLILSLAFFLMPAVTP